MGKSDYSSLIRDFEGVRNQLRYIALRGYRTRTEYYNICVKEKDYDATLKKIHFLLQGTPEAFESYKKDGKTGYRFCNRPMYWQDNPLAEAWRYRIPDQKDNFLYMAILMALKDRKAKSLSGIIAYLYDIDERIDSVAEETLGEKVEKLEGRNDKFRKKVWNTLNEMEEACLIYSKKENAKRKQYSLEKDIWAEFEEAELEEIHDYLEFLKNVIPFELPYYFLQKNLELWRDFSQKKQVFLFRHRNPINVVDSAIWYLILKGAKSKQSIPIKTIPRYIEFHTPQDIDVETGLPIVCGLDEELTPGKLEYNCLTGQMYQKGEGEGQFYPIGIVNAPTGELFHELHSVYFEQMVQLLNKEKRRRWRFENLKRQFQTGEQWDDIIKQRLFPEEKTFYSFFDFNEFYQKYERRSLAKDVPFFMTRLQREALKSLADMPEPVNFSSLFLSEGTIEKIKKETEGFESTWDVKDIEFVNQKSKQMREPSRKELGYVMKHIRQGRYIADKAGERYIPLKIQYSLYYNEFRILVVDEKEKRHKMISFDIVDTNSRKAGPLDDVDKINWMEKLELKEAELEISFESDTAATDNLFSEEWLMMLSGYEKEVEYQADNPEEQNGIYRIKIKYWPEDEQELKEELETILKKYQPYRYKFSF